MRTLLIWLISIPLLSVLLTSCCKMYCSDPIERKSMASQVSLTNGVPVDSFSYSSLTRYRFQPQRTEQQWEIKYRGDTILGILVSGGDTLRKLDLHIQAKQMVDSWIYFIDYIRVQYLDSGYFVKERNWELMYDNRAVSRLRTGTPETMALADCVVTTLSYSFVQSLQNKMGSVRSSIRFVGGRPISQISYQYGADSLRPTAILRSTPTGSVRLVPVYADFATRPHGFEADMYRYLLANEEVQVNTLLSGEVFPSHVLAGSTVSRSYPLPDSPTGWSMYAYGPEVRRTLSVDSSQVNRKPNSNGSYIISRVDEPDAARSLRLRQEVEIYVMCRDCGLH